MWNTKLKYFYKQIVFTCFEITQNAQCDIAGIF
jgi:hypothetical protein